MQPQAFSSSGDDFRQALIAYAGRSRPDDLSALTGYLERHPDSAWAPALLTNMGDLYLHYGYFSKAEAAYLAAWKAGRDANDVKVRAIVDHAVGALARLYAQFGQLDELSRFLADVSGRAVSGSATEDIQYARETLNLVKRDPRHLYVCGPAALKELLLARNYSYGQVSFLDRVRANSKGTSLAQLAGFADKAGLSYKLIHRDPGATIPDQGVVHWRLGHFATIAGAANGRFRVIDPGFPGQEVWLTPGAIDSEASGYFLVPGNPALAHGWRSVGDSEAAGVWGKGPTNGTRPGGAGDRLAGGSGNSSGGGPGSPGSWPGTPGQGGPPNGGPGSCGMCTYDFDESSVAVVLSDTPVGYIPAIGPAARVGIRYNQREDSQPAVFNFSNLGQKWSLSWTSYVTDDPTNPGGNVTRYMSGGGAFYYSGYNSASGSFAAQDDDGSLLTLASQQPATYRRQLQDGTVEVYAHSDGSVAYPRRIFLSQVIDPRGNAITLNYDSSLRLTALVDAAGRSTTFSYSNTNAFLITKVTDPFGRSAQFSYDGQGRLASATDVVGIVSSFGYDANSLVNTLTTPYGTTAFAYTAPGTGGPPRFAQGTDALGLSDREEWVEPSYNSDSDPSSTVPQGMPAPLTNSFLEYRNSFYWNKDAYVAAGCTVNGGCDYTKARESHFAHILNTSLKSTVLESLKYPLENRIWFEYPGQTGGSYQSGSYDKPIAIGRVLDDGTSQVTLLTYDASALYNQTSAVDPAGRKTTYAYSNGVDVSSESQVTGPGASAYLNQTIYNSQHEPLERVDSAGQKTAYTYNAKGQLLTTTNALGQMVTNTYASNGDLSSISNANGQTQGSFTYDSADRPSTFTDSEGLTLTFAYDNADRVTKITYPDGTTREFTYRLLDVARYKDRLGRYWNYTYDASRRLVAAVDPTGAKTTLGYNGEGELTSLTEPNSNVTTWSFDVEGRLLTKSYSGTVGYTNTYEATTSRLKSVQDALGQTKQYGYTIDNRLASIAYLNPVNPTPGVQYQYDRYFPFVTSMVDGNGTTTFNYVPPGLAGALKLSTQNEPFGSVQISYGYDSLSRIVSRTITGSGAESYQYDNLGRLLSHSSDAGSFGMTYLGQTQQMTGRSLSGGAALRTTWSYLDNAQDRRLAGISNTGINSAQYTNFTFNSGPENLISGMAESSDASLSEPSSQSQALTFNKLNQVASAGQQTFTYDADGNLTSDGSHQFLWDAENRLVGITYSGQSGRQTAFTYDGMGRRTGEVSTPAGGGNTTSSTFVWCGVVICQTRQGGSAVKAYVAEAEVDYGASGNQLLYYGVDQLGSVRRVFSSSGSSGVDDYDPFGVPLQSTGPQTDFGFAGLVRDSDSGLYLATFRAYNPVYAQWLSRDPLGEHVNPFSPLYAYTRNAPTMLIDPLGLACQAFISGGGSVIVPGFGASISINLGLNFDGGFPSFYGQVTGAYGVGGGLYVGGGLGEGLSSGPTPTTGYSPPSSYGEGDLGVGEVSGQVTGSVDGDGNVSSGGSVGRVGPGAGAGAFVGQQVSLTGVL